MLKVLIVDDEPAICNALESVGSTLGWSTTTADGTEAALQVMQTDSFDTLITDIIMPGVDGVALISEVKSNWPNTKIIAISGGGDQGAGAYKPEAITTNSYLHAAEAAGADTVLTKPFSIDDIMNAVEALV